MPQPCRLLTDRPAGGAWNMAVDEALLESAASSGVATLRFYGWTGPTLSLGYFQPLAECTERFGGLQGGIVRRSSGGGAILHDQEITYSLAVPCSCLQTRDSMGLYQAVHGSLVAVLSDLGISASLQARQAPGAQERLLCFQRRSAGDVLVAGQKVCGSAQRRSHGAILQHGSLLIRRSPAAPWLPGLADVSTLAIDAERLMESWHSRLAAALDLRLSPGVMNDEETQRAKALTTGKYAMDAWTGKR